MATAAEVIEALERFAKSVQQVAADIPEAQAANAVYEDGWNARQLLAHIASTSGVAGFLLNLANAPAWASPAGATVWPPARGP